MISLQKYPVYMIREELGLSHVQIAREAGITPESVTAAVKSSQKNKRISAATALLILSVFNKHRTARNLPELQIADLDWKVRGYTD